MSTTATPTTNPMLKQFRAARNAGAPLIAIQTPDPRACVEGIVTTLADKKHPMVTWDTIRGILAANKLGEPMVSRLQPDASRPLIDLPSAAQAAEKLGEGGILFVLNAHRYLTSSPSNTADVQAVWNLRDQYKTNGRTLVLLAPALVLPAELANDTLVLEESLPDTAQLRAIVVECHENANSPANPITTPTGQAMERIVDAIAGLSAFPAEQAVSMSMRKTGLDMDALWERKRQMVEQTRGLTVYRGKENFTQIAGLANIKRFYNAVIKGEEPPRVIVFMDEIEKAVGGSEPGSGTDVSTDQKGTLLTFMETEAASGSILIGPAGTGKSMLAKAMGNEAECPTVILDLGGMKDSLMGSSEQNIRAALRVCKAIGGDRMYFIATCNSITALSPELRRRFTDGIFMIDLPDKEERAAAWALYCAKYKITGDRAKRPADVGWTAAEIRNCCKQAWKLRMTLEEAAQFIVPVAISSAATVEALRRSATGKYISASAPGLYKMPEGSDEPASAPAPAMLPGGKRRVTLPE